MTSDKFYTSAKGYLKVNPSMAYVIWSNPTEDQDRQMKARAMWLEYLEQNGLHKTAKTWKSIWAGAGKAVTVPAEDPGVFDLRYMRAEKAPRTSYGARWQARDPSEPSQSQKD
jgi:hypothetical protein